MKPLPEGYLALLFENILNIELRSQSCLVPRNVVTPNQDQVVVVSLLRLYERNTISITDNVNGGFQAKETSLQGHVRANKYDGFCANNPSSGSVSLIIGDRNNLEQVVVFQSLYVVKLTPANSAGVSWNQPGIKKSLGSFQTHYNVNFSFPPSGSEVFFNPRYFPDMALPGISSSGITTGITNRTQQLGKDW